MPPAIIAVAASVATWAVTTYVTSVILATILLVAISVATTVLMAKLTKQRLNQGQEIKLKVDSSMPRQIAVGRTATGGSLVWAFTYTDNSKKPNRYIVRIIALSDLPINGVVSIREGNNTLTFAGDVTTGLRACNQHRTKNGTAAFWVKVIKGSPTATADADIRAMAGGWTANHKGTNIAYLVQKSDYDADAFPNGEPQLTVEVDGAKVYDLRQDSTVAGGSGSQRLDTPSTWAYSRNAAVIATQLLRGFYSKGVLLCGAQALPTDFRTSNLIEAADLCDISVNTNGGPKPSYRAGMMINAEEPTVNFLVDLQSAFDGNIADRGGQVTLLPGASRTPVFTLTDDDIIPTEQKSWQPYAPLGQLTNHILGTFADAANGYTEKAFPTQKNAQWEIDDGGERFSAQYAFRAVTDSSQVQRITRRMHQATRYQGTGAFVLPLWALELEQYDWFVWQSDRFGFTKTFIAAKVDITQDLKIAVVASETPATFSDWDHVTQEVDPNDTTGSYPGPELVIPDYTLAAIRRTDPVTQTEYIVIEVTVTGIEAGAEATTFEVEFAKATALTTTWTGGTYNSINQVVTLWNLLPNTSYAVRLRSSDGQRFSDWSSWAYVTTPSWLNSINDLLGDIADASTTADWRNILSRPALAELYYDFNYPSVGGAGGFTAAGWGSFPAGQFSIASVTNSPGGKALVMGDGATANDVSIFGPEWVPYNSADLYEVAFDVEVVSAPDAGTTYFLGVAARDRAGNNLGNSYNYIAASNLSQNAAVGTRFIKKGYFTGFTANLGGDASNNPLAPSALPDGTAAGYGQGGAVEFRPMVLSNYNGKRGSIKVHACRITRIPARLATQDEISFGAVTLKEAPGGATATLTNFKTGLGVAAGILGQGALAVLNDIDWQTKVVGVGKPANNAGTANILMAFGSYSTVVANSVSKSGGTHGAFQGGATGMPYKSAVFISCSVVTSPTWWTHIALDPVSATNTNISASGVWLLRFKSNATDRSLELYKNGSLVSSWTVVGVATSTDRIALVCNGVRVFAMLNGVVYGGDTSAYNATADTTYWPKVMDFYNTGESGHSISDIQYGAWTDVRVFLGDGITAIAQNAYKTDEGIASGITGQGPGATAAASDVLNSYAPYGQNLIPLSDQAADTIFFLYNNPDAMTLNYPVAWAGNGFSGWTTSNYILGGNIKASVAYQSGRVASPTFGYANFSFKGLNGNTTSEIAWTVTPGDRLIASCYMHHHRCGANLMVRLIDSTGTNPNLDYSVSTTGLGEGGTCYSLSQYERIYKLVTVPAGYNICALYVQKQNTAVGQADSYLWWAAPMLERAAPNQTTPSPYQPGPPTGTLAGKTTIDLGSNEVTPNGGIPPTIPDNGFTYTATVSSITISWPTMTVYRSNGTTISIASGSQSCTALSSAYSWKFYPYIVDTGGSTATIQFAAAQGALGTYYGTQQIAYLTSGSVAAKAYVNQLGRIDMGSFNAATTSGGTGGGGGGGWNCLHQDTVLSNKLAIEVSAGDFVWVPEGAAEITEVKHWECSEWIELWSGDEMVIKTTRRHLFYRAADMSEVAAEDVKLGDLLATGSDQHLHVTGITLCNKKAIAVGIGIAQPHLHYAGVHRILCHNGTQKP